MNITVREVTDNDREACIWVEHGALPTISYVNDVWTEFTKKGKPLGCFLGAFVDGEKLAGIGKLTHLYGEICWLETLRVHPDFQGKGVGKAIYGEFINKISAFGYNSVGMYTEFENIKSAGLAQKFGLSKRGQFKEFTKPVNSSGCGMNDFFPVSETEAEAVLQPLTEKLEFLIINRTFYPVKKGLAEHLAKRGWLFSDIHKNVLVSGYRFQPEKALHVAFIHGDEEKISSFIDAYATRLNASKISAMRSADDIETHNRLETLGFSATGFKFFTLWREL